MMEGRWNKGFIALDALVSWAAIALLLNIAFQIFALYNYAKESYQSEVDKLVMVANYIVKSGAVVEREGVRQSNWIEEAKLEKVKEEIGAKYPEVKIAYRPQGTLCIYRLVAVGEEKEIKQLFVCE